MYMISIELGKVRKDTMKKDKLNILEVMERFDFVNLKYFDNYIISRAKSRRPDYIALSESQFIRYIKLTGIERFKNIDEVNWYGVPFFIR